MKRHEILIVGCGKMAGALLVNWFQGGDRFTIINPALDAPPDGVKLVRETQSLDGRQFDVIVIGIKPQLIDKVVPDHAPLLAEDGYVLSMAAGCEFDRIKSVTGNAPVVRIMPNLPASIGKGVSAICASADVSDDQLAHARALMERTGSVVVVDEEDQIDRFTAIAGSGPGYVFEFARTYVDAATKMGFDANSARKMVLDMIDGTIAMARASDDPLSDLRNSVTSKGGTTAAGLDALNGSGDLSVLIEDTVNKAYSRALELK